jgi:hypothetical protein
MRFMMMMIPRVYQPDTPPGEKAGEGFAPPAEDVARMMKFNEDPAKAGALIALDGLHPGSKGARVAFSGGKPKVTDGPFTETKEQLGGILILEATDLNHAIRLITKHPGLKIGPFEIRPGEDLSAVVAESERRRSQAG